MSWEGSLYLQQTSYFRPTSTHQRQAACEGRDPLGLSLRFYSVSLEETWTYFTRKHQKPTGISCSSDTYDGSEAFLRCSFSKHWLLAFTVLTSCNQRQFWGGGSVPMETGMPTPVSPLNTYAASVWNKCIITIITFIYIYIWAEFLCIANRQHTNVSTFS